MKNFIIMIFALLFAVQNIAAAQETSDKGLYFVTKKQVVKKEKTKKENPKKDDLTTYENDTYIKNGQCPDFSKLRTTFMDGVFCEKINANGQYKNLKHYFYNTKTEKLVLVPDTFFVSPDDKEAVGALYKEYEQYGEKTNICTCRGKKYEIQKFRGNLSRSWLKNSGIRSEWEK